MIELRISKDREIVFNGDYVNTNVLIATIEEHQAQIPLLQKLEKQC